jgi:chromosomal replication initiation ATPase DnaA
MKEISYMGLPGIKYREYVVLKESECDTIIEAVCEYYSVAKEVALSRSRIQTRVWVRQIIAYLIRKYSTLTVEKIGEVLSPKNPYDHTTILYSIQAVKDRISIDPKVKKEISDICLLF